MRFKLGKGHTSITRGNQKHAFRRKEKDGWKKGKKICARAGGGRQTEVRF